MIPSMKSEDVSLKSFFAIKASDPLFTNVVA